MKKQIILLLSFAVLFAAYSFVQAQQKKPYTPQPIAKYKELRELFPELTDIEIEKSVNISRQDENIELMNAVLIYLEKRKLIKQNKKLPPIFFVYSNTSNALDDAGGMYYSSKNIMVIDATALNLSEKAQKSWRMAINFVNLAPIMAHELMHYEDFINTSVHHIYSWDARALSEWNAYKRSEKVVADLMKMDKAEIREAIPIAGFYDSLHSIENYCSDMRKHYRKSIDAAEIFLNNEDKICEMTGLDKDGFKMLSFSPKRKLNKKNESHIITVESDLYGFKQTFIFNINILTGEIKNMNNPVEMESFRKKAKRIKWN